jgi:hypothetical protein
MSSIEYQKLEGWAAANESPANVYPLNC